MTTPPSDDSDLRSLLRDAVSDVHPHGTLDQVRSRAPKTTATGRRWVLPTLAAAAATVAVIAGAVALPGNDSTRDDPPAAQAPATPQDDSPTRAAEPDVMLAVPAYFIGTTAQGPRLYREFQRQPVCPTEDCKLAASVRTAVSGQPEDPDYRVVWPDRTSVNGATWDGELLTVDLGGTDLWGRPAGMDASEAELAVQQVVYSVQAALGHGRPPVRLLVDGEPTDQVLGVATSEPLMAASADSTLATIWVNSPTEGATVSPRFEVSGQASTFEANVVWELKRGGEVVEHGFATAKECCTLSPYSFTVSAEPGDYTLVVHDTDESDGEGVGTSQDTKQITVQ